MCTALGWPPRRQQQGPDVQRGVVQNKGIRHSITVDSSGKAIASHAIGSGQVYFISLGIYILKRLFADMSHCGVVRFSSGDQSVTLLHDKRWDCTRAFRQLSSAFAHSQLPRAAVKLSLALRSHSGEITLPGLVGAWMLVAFSVKLPAGGGQFGAAFFRISTSTFWVMFLLLVWGRADNCGLLFWLDSTSSMLSTSFSRSGTTALFLKNSAARNLLVALTLLLVN